MTRTVNKSVGHNNGLDRMLPLAVNKLVSVSYTDFAITETAWSKCNVECT